MTNSELKEILIARIQQIDDVAFLKAIKTITDGKTDELPMQPQYRQNSGWYTADPKSRKAKRINQYQTNNEYFEEMEQFLQDF